MSDLISREAAIDALDEINAEIEDGYGFQYEKWRVHFRVLPSAQPKSYREGYQAGFKDAQPEIVRCKDCKHNQLPATSGNANCEIFYGMTDQDGFCHMAERRTDAQT